MVRLTPLRISCLVSAITAVRSLTSSRSFLSSPGAEVVEASTVEMVAFTAAEANRSLGRRRIGRTAGSFDKRAAVEGEGLGLEEGKEDGIKGEARWLWRETAMGES